MLYSFLERIPGEPMVLVHIPMLLRALTPTLVVVAELPLDPVWWAILVGVVLVVLAVVLVVHVWGEI